MLWFLCSWSKATFEDDNFQKSSFLPHLQTYLHVSFKNVCSFCFERVRNCHSRSAPTGKSSDSNLWNCGNTFSVYCLLKIKHWYFVCPLLFSAKQGLTSSDKRMSEGWRNLIISSERRDIDILESWCQCSGDNCTFPFHFDSLFCRLYLFHTRAI